MKITRKSFVICIIRVIIKIYYKNNLITDRWERRQRKEQKTERKLPKENRRYVFESDNDKKA